ncbi:MAG: GNAT family N-acetyltransferase [Alphaproteobacteria bacterium]|nr:GNAT family N-acetyltransferase [Alphaproteobacteria bacterium]
MAVHDDPDFSRLPAPLADLFARAAERSFFSLPLWYHVLARYGTEGGSHARLYVDGRTRAALVCRLLAKGHRLLSLSNYYSTEHGPVYAAGGGALGEALGEIAREIADARFDAVQLAGLDPHDESFARLSDAFAATGFRPQRYFDSGTWYEETAGVDFARYVAARPGEVRNTWRRKSKALAAAHRVDYVFHDDESAIAGGVADYQRVYAESWKHAEPFPDFMPHLIRAAATTGALRLGILKVDDVPAAAQCWIAWRGRVTIYKLAHAMRFDDLSIGTILTMRMMERVLERDKPHEIDFGRGDDRYKKSFLAQRRERWGLLIANPHTARGRILGWREAAAQTFKRLVHRR